MRCRITLRLTCNSSSAKAASDVYRTTRSHLPGEAWRYALGRSTGPKINMGLPLQSEMTHCRGLAG